MSLWTLQKWRTLLQKELTDRPFCSQLGVSSVDADPLPQGAGVAMAAPPVAFGTCASGISLIFGSLSWFRGLSESHASGNWKAALMVASLYRFSKWSLSGL